MQIPVSSCVIDFLPLQTVFWHTTKEKKKKEKQKQQQQTPPKLQNIRSKMQILVAATEAEAQGTLTCLHSAKEVCHISHRSTTAGF